MRNSKLTKERKAIILEEIENGSTKEMAAAIAGISEPTLYNWIKRGKEEDLPEDLEQLRKSELVERAKQHGIKGIRKMNKEQLIQAITEEESAYYSFYMDMKLAEAKGLKYHINIIRRAALEDWNASKWYLSRRDPENWGNKDSLKVENQHSGAIETKHTEETKIEIIQRLEQDPVLQDLYLQAWERERELIE